MAGEITITGRAAAKMKEFLGAAREGYGVRVKVVEGGCSGLEYRLEIDAPQPGDQIVEKEGATVLLDPKSLLFLSGTELDYKKELMQSAFVFNNPNAKRTCGCGTSFTT